MLDKLNKSITYRLMDARFIIKCLGGSARLATLLSTTITTVYMWKYRNRITARWLPTIWALLETHCPEVAAEMDRDAFLGVRLPSNEVVA